MTIETMVLGLKEFLENTYPDYCTANSDAEITLNPFSVVRLEDWDINKYQNKTEAFLLPEGIDSEVEEMDGSEELTLYLSLMMFIREKESKAILSMLRHGDVMKRMIQENVHAGGIISDVVITRTEFFRSVENTDAVKAVKFSFRVTEEY